MATYILSGGPGVQFGVEYPLTQYNRDGVAKCSSVSCWNTTGEPVFGYALLTNGTRFPASGEAELNGDPALQPTRFNLPGNTNLEIHRVFDPDEGGEVPRLFGLAKLHLRQES